MRLIDEQFLCTPYYGSRQMARHLRRQGFCLGRHRVRRLMRIEEALALYGRPEIFNTDQGSQFTSFDFTSVLKKNGIKISMDGKGRWMDNVFIERLWRSLKYECVYLNAFETGSQARDNIGAWLNHYNQTRPHSTFNGQTPNEVYNEAKNYQGHAPDKKKQAA